MEDNFGLLLTHLSFLSSILSTEKRNITAHDGKFGPYVKCGKINASILGDQTIDSLKLEDAIRLIDERKAKMGLKKKKKN